MDGEEGGAFVSSAERDSSREQRWCLLHFQRFLFFSPGNMASEEAKLGKLLTRRVCQAREVERNRRDGFVPDQPSSVRYDVWSYLLRVVPEARREREEERRKKRETYEAFAEELASCVRTPDVSVENDV